VIATHGRLRAAAAAHQQFAYGVFLFRLAAQATLLKTGRCRRERKRDGMTPLDRTPRELAAWDTMHILVAHDNPRFLAPLATALRSVGHEVTACDNAMSAWDALNSASIDLLITQTQFPFPQPDGTRH
jgi:PleD family two-component response regulator